MGLQVDITINDNASRAVQALFDVVSKGNRDKMFTVASRASLLGIQDYYEKFNESGGWINKSFPTHGAGRKSTGFGNKITEGWNVSKVSATGFTLNNGAPWLASKFRDWTQTRKKKWITVPLVPEAHGVRAMDYPGKTFFAGRAIMEEMPSGENRPVYALVKEVDHKAVKGALAPEDVYIDPAIESIQDHIRTALGV